jgi:hypothetical protein
MTFTNKNHIYPKSLTFKKKVHNIKLIVHGQGVFIFKNQNNETQKECYFNIYDKNDANGLKIKFKSDSVQVNYIKSNEPLVNSCINNTQGLSNKSGVYYWFSIDSQNQRLYAGIGEARIENVIYEYHFEKTKINKLFLESLAEIYIPAITNNYIYSVIALKLLRDPITLHIPLLIKHTNQLTIADIGSNMYLPSSHLPTEAQKLYNCISGEQFTLNTDDFPDFYKAIEYSLSTPGCWCYDKIQSKSREFNPDKPNILETYLRITLGENNGESPGIPYVIEIWPPQHYSPVHNHGGANAIIRVLEGSINVSLFAYLCTDSQNIDPFSKVDFTKDDITWISSTLNQVHQLRNIENKTCVTIQCYLYDNDNYKHYDYFDYLDDLGNKQQYEPDSDMDFIAFKKIIKEEWESKPKESWFTSIIRKFIRYDN